MDNRNGDNRAGYTLVRAMQVACQHVDKSSQVPNKWWVLFVMVACHFDKWCFGLLNRVFVLYDKNCHVELS
jgi:hypothetical protein